jgi:hypothetical protein
MVPCDFFDRFQQAVTTIRQRKFMKTIGVQSHVALCAIAFVLLTPISPARAGAPHAGPALTQGSQFPGSHVPSTGPATNKHHRAVEVTFTKWFTTFPLMEGFTDGDIVGDFVGEVLLRQVTPDDRARLVAIYEVQNGQHSLTALIRGWTSVATGAAQLEGVVLNGWRAGAQVHVAFQTTTNCPGAPDARTCFQGTITISPDSKD